MAKEPIRILFFTRILPEAGVSGTATYAYDVLGYLRRNGCEIRVAWTQYPSGKETAFHWTIPAESARLFDIRLAGNWRVGRHFLNWRAAWLPFKARALHRVKQALRFVWRPAPKAQGTRGWHEPAYPSWDRPCEEAERKFFEEQVASFSPDIVIVNYSWMLAGLPQVEAKMWALTHDFRFRRCFLDDDGQFETVVRQNKAAAEERAWLKNVTTILAIQENDAECFRNSFPEKDVVTACMSAPARRALPLFQEAVCGFVGSNNEANQLAVEWFVDLVWPTVLAEIPTARFRVAGSVGERLSHLRDVARVEILGLVDSMEAFYADLALVVIPLQEGSGVKIKFVEAVSHGRACVTTSVGLDGLEFLRDEVGLADRAPDFASEVIRLLENAEDRQKMADASRALVLKQLHPDVCYGPLLGRARAV